MQRVRSEKSSLGWTNLQIANNQLSSFFQSTVYFCKFNVSVRSRCSNRQQEQAGFFLEALMNLLLYCAAPRKRKNEIKCTT